MYRRSKGFSLIELLVVIAIIAILAAILFPIFLTAKEKGKETTCKSNAKQIATAVQQYLDDWNGCYPDQTTAKDLATGQDILYTPKDYSNGEGTKWLVNFAHRYRDDKGKFPLGLSKPLMGYLKNVAVFKCPSELSNARKKQFPSVHIWIDSDLAASSYYYKHALCMYADQTGGPTKMSAITYPTKVTLLYEEAWHSSKENPLLWNQPKLGPIKRCMAVFTDGHAGYIDIPYISSYDGNWYFYNNSVKDKTTPIYCWDVSNGARDVY